MSQYRRAKIPGGTYFFTVNCAQRKNNTLLIDQVETLRESMRVVKQRHPFEIDAIVILPEHLHCIWTLPEGDADFSRRWTLIKANFSRLIPKGEVRSESRVKRGERGIWQRRYWEHYIRDENDFERHVNYIHWNPVKHGLVRNVKDWPYSSFHKFVKKGVYQQNWVCEDDDLEVGEI